MVNENKTDFDQKAAAWDENPMRVKLANDVADTIIREIRPTQDMDALDYGCGTGLVTLRLQPFVKSITGVDSSRGMLEVIERKLRNQRLSNVRTQFLDFEQGGKVEGRFHLVVSSMTLHHVQEPAIFLKQLYDLLYPEGCLGIADLDKEDGTFHDDNKGVFHFGFERDYLKKLLKESGFRDLSDVTATTVIKRFGDKEDRKFPVFLITGRK